MNTLFILLDADPWCLDDLTGLIVGVLIFALPILVAAFVYRHKMNETNKRAEIVLKALEKGPGEVPEELLKSLNSPQKSLKERLLSNLRRGLALTITGLVMMIFECAKYSSTRVWGANDSLMIIFGAVLLAAGVASLVYYFEARRTMQREIEAEEHEAEMKKNV